MGTAGNHYDVGLSPSFTPSRSGEFVPAEEGRLEGGGSPTPAVHS